MVQVVIECPRCNGTGIDPTYSGKSQESPSCRRCNARGTVETTKIERNGDNEPK